MSLLDEVGEELEEEGDHEEADVHTVDIGIGGDDDFIVAQSVKTVFDVECGLQEVELLVFIHHLFGQSVAVEGLSAQGEHGLRVDIAAFRDGTAGRVALRDEDGGVETWVVVIGFRFLCLFLRCLWRWVVEMHAAVAQFAIVEVGLFGPFTRQFRHASDGLALLLVLLNFLQEHVGHVEVFVEIVVDVLLHEVANEFVDTHAREWERVAVGILVGRPGERAELDFRLALEKRFYHTDGDGGHEAVAHVLHVEVLAEIFLDGAGDVFLEGTLMGAALRGVLAIDKRVIFLTILLRMGEGDVDTWA